MVDLIRHIYDTGGGWGLFIVFIVVVTSIRVIFEAIITRL